MSLKRDKKTQRLKKIIRKRQGRYFSVSARKKKRNIKRKTTIAVKAFSAWLSRFSEYVMKMASSVYALYEETKKIRMEKEKNK